MALYAGTSCLPFDQVVDPGQRASLDATVLLVHSDALELLPSGCYALSTLPLRQALGVEVANWQAFPFAESPSAVRFPCLSGTLLARRWVLTALHLRRRSPPANLLRDWRFLIGYTQPNPQGSPAALIDGQNLFAATSVTTGAGDDPDADWALFELPTCAALTARPDRRLAREPAASGDTAYLTGHPFGMPAVLSGPAGIERLVGSAAIRTALPAFHCHSGGGLFDAKTHRQMGILLAGEHDLQPLDAAAGLFEWKIYGADRPYAERCLDVTTLPESIRCALR